MFKATFVRYQPETLFGGIGVFTEGKDYDLEVVDNQKNYAVIDDLGVVIKFSSLVSKYYVFNRLGITYKAPEVTKEQASLKYFINGKSVSKGYFYESLGELNEADKLGVKVSSVKFEIKFE